MKPIRRKRCGATLIETVTAASLSVLALTTGIMIFVAGLGAWARGQGRMDAETNSQMAVRIMADELREAMSVFVDADGLGLTYRLPQKDADGDFIVPPVWDGVERRIEFDGNTNELLLDDGATPRAIATHITLDDPSEPGPDNYVVFEPGAGAITRQLTVFVATEFEAGVDHTAYGRHRETIYLRNIPALTR